MALPSSGPVSFSQINAEIDRSSTTQLKFSDLTLRATFRNETVNAQISLSQSRSKTGLPGVLGMSFKGGYYIGQVTNPAGTSYRIIAAPRENSTVLKWKTSDTGPESFNSNFTVSTSNAEFYDGWGKTNSMNSSTYPAAQWCKSLTTGGYTDWYLPAYYEALLFYTNNTSIPSNQRANSWGGTAFLWWTSSEFSAVGQRAWGYDNSATDGWFPEWKTGLAHGGLADDNAVRAVRRLQV